MSFADFHEPAARKRLEHALLLLARQHGGSAESSARAKEALAIWRTKDPLNESAALAAMRGWRATQASDLRSDMQMPLSQQARHQRTRRRVLSVLGIAGVAAATACVTRWHWQQPLQTIALNTGLGEVVSHNLADGTHIDLTPNTSALVALYRDQREVQLTHGAMRFDVARDEKRPFIVTSAWGRVRVLGTVFTVDARNERMKVAVAHGRVAVWTRNGESNHFAETPDVVLQDGQGVRVDADGLSRTREVDASNIGAWRDGWLVFDRTPLKEVVMRWNDYLVRPMQLEGGENLLLTGSFRVRDPDTFVEALPRSLPVKVLRSAQGQVSIVQR